MAGETLITVVGNLTADPELKYTQSGKAVVNFTVASTPRTFNRQSNEWEDGDALFLRCSQWNESGENVAGSLTKGARVIVQGYLKQRSWETREGEKRTGFELEVADIGPSLKYATAVVTRRARGQAAGPRGGQPDPWAQQPSQPAADPWGAPPAQQAATQGAWATPGAYDDETPF